jgi:hypothetical protein
VAGVWRRATLSLVCLAVAGLIGVAAIADHRSKRQQINRAELAEWYCAHEHTRCGGPSSERIEASWNDRQDVYEIGVIAFGGVGLGRIAFTRVRMRRR